MATKFQMLLTPGKFKCAARELTEFMVINRGSLPCRIGVVMKPISVVQQMSKFGSISWREYLIIGALLLLAKIYEQSKQKSRQIPSWIRNAGERFKDWAQRSGHCALVGGIRVLNIFAHHLMPTVVFCNRVLINVPFRQR